jgi:hypothetical protein
MSTWVPPSGMAWSLSAADTTEDTTAIITPKRSTTRAAPGPWP